MENKNDIEEVLGRFKRRARDPLLKLMRTFSRLDREVEDVRQLVNVWQDERRADQERILELSDKVNRLTVEKADLEYEKNLYKKGYTKMRKMVKSLDDSVNSK